jgi:hypothetical protein
MNTEPSPAADFLARLDVEQYLDTLNALAALAEGARERLGDLLHIAAQVPHGPAQFDPGEVLLSEGRLSARERDAVLESKRRATGAPPHDGQAALGNILVADRQITRAQLESALRRQVSSGRHLGEELIHAGHASRGQVAGGLSLQRKLVAGALIVATGFVPVAGLLPSAYAGQANATMAVSVRVVSTVRMQVSYQASQVTITPLDIEHGFVEVLSASRFSVSADGASGFSLDFRPVGSLFESAMVAGFGHAVRLGPDGGSVFIRGMHSPQSMHDLNYRFTLSPGLLPGVYAWPLQVSVQPLP